MMIPVFGNQGNRPPITDFVDYYTGKTNKQKIKDYAFFH